MPEFTEGCSSESDVEVVENTSAGAHPEAEAWGCDVCGEWEIPILCGTCTACGVRRDESDETKERLIQTRRAEFAARADEQRRRADTQRFQVRMQVQMLSSKLGGESAELRELLKRIDGLPIGEQLVQTTAALRRLQQQQQQ